MIFRKKVRAGTLLYALLMLGIFSLLLQFYIQSQLAAGHAWQAKQAETKAYFMAQMTKEEFLKMRPKPSENEEKEEAKKSSDDEGAKEVPPDSKKQVKAAGVPRSGQVNFTEGQASYEKTAQSLQVQIRLDSGQNYIYRFPIPSQN